MARHLLEIGRVWKPHAGGSAPLARTGLLALAIFALVLSLAACSRAQVYYQVASGNWAYDRGDYQEANIDYLDAGLSGLYPGYTAYDLGNVYHALGEGEAAAAEWAKAERSGDPALKEPTLFNEGILAYEIGHYRVAYEAFRRALEIDPSDISAKIDLELAYQKMRTQENPPGGGRGPTETIRVVKDKSQVNRELDFIRDREDQHWKAAAKAPAASDVPDW